LHYIAVATDYDATIAEHRVVDEDTIKALEKLHLAARRLILVTGESWPGWSR
jgi:hydroxymethylpyrimidine pyrophosphatase-like HAD family hydrolase